MPVGTHIGRARQDPTEREAIRAGAEGRRARIIDGEIVTLASKKLDGSMSERIASVELAEQIVYVPRVILRH